MGSFLNAELENLDWNKITQQIKTLEMSKLINIDGSGKIKRPFVQQ